MRILITGATGLVGRVVIDALVARGDQVIAHSRSQQRSTRGVSWLMGAPSDPETFVAAVAEADAIINLTGHTIATRWTRKARKAIANSRIETTAALLEALRRAPPKARTWLNASAVGFYGAEASQPCDEQTPVGRGFLADIARSWEAAARPAMQIAHTRLVLVRLGVVLAREGGALAQMVRPVRAFVGGPIGTGSQWMSWIHIDDVVRLMLWALDDQRVEGPINAVAPRPMTNEDFMHTLARVLHRPCRLRVPAGVISWALGAMGQELLLGGQHASADKALRMQFRFAYPNLEAALMQLFASGHGP